MNLSFSFLLFCMTGWIVSLFLFYKIANPNLVLFLGRLNFFFSILLSSSVFVFVYFFPKIIWKFPSGIYWLAGAENIFLLLITLFTPLIDKAELIDGAARSTVYGNLYLWFVIHFLGYIFLSCYLLLRKIGHLNNVEKGQVKFVLFGILLGVAFGSSTNIIIPLIFNYYDAQNLGILSAIIFAAFAFLSISKHRFLNLQIVATHVVTFLIWSLLILDLFLPATKNLLFLDILVLFLMVSFGVILLRNVVHEVSQKQQLEELTKKLHDLDQQKNEFISMAAHELRAPMTAIKGYISMILEGDVGNIPPKAREYLVDVNSINDRMVRLVNNMLNVSRIEEGRMSFQFEKDELSRVIRTVYSQFLPEANRKGLDYKVQIPSDIKDKVYADVDKLHEVVGNLISNAIKYTEKGHVYVRLVQPSEGIIRFEVEDTGPGITKEEQEKLFQKFYRVESNVGKTTGTGLGLYISRLMIEKFNGKIGVDSDPGKGSVFWFELPVQQN